MFEPHRFERLLGRKVLVIQHADVDEVETVPMDGGVGRMAAGRMLVRTRGGAEELFTLRRVGEVVKAIGAVIR